MNYIHTQLMIASTNGDIIQLQQILDTLTTVDAKKQALHKVFMAKIKKGLATDVKALLDIGANPNSLDAGISAILWAYAYGDIDLIRLLITAGADVNSTNPQKWTALIWAARDGRGYIVDILLKAGANVNAINSFKWTALMWAVSQGYASIVEKLLNAGADLGSAKAHGYTTLQLAARKSYRHIVELLLAHPKIHSFVADAEPVIGTWLPDNDGSVSQAFYCWHQVQRACLIARTIVNCADSLLFIVDTVKKKGMTSTKLSYIRDEDGYTILGRAATAGASKKVLAALVSGGLSTLISGDLNNTSVGDLANKAGQPVTAHFLYNAAVKEAIYTNHNIKRLRSIMIVAVNNLPIDIIDKILEFYCTNVATIYTIGH